jgi:cysteinyl-tRNA synthetase
MSETHLGESFDIHGGGLDLIFPHHENEIAQSECVHGGKIFARYWLHNGFVTVDGAKMAKSEGNFRTIRDVLAEAGGARFGEAARFAMLMGHYRDPLDWTSERLARAKQGLDRFYLALRGAAKPPKNAPLPAKVQAALDDDLNTPLAIAALYELLAELNKASDPAEKARLQGELIAGGAVLGLLQQDSANWFTVIWQNTEGNPVTWVNASGEATNWTNETFIEWINDQIEARNAARKAQNFAEADRIRTELALKGILLEDGPGGTTWRRAG